MATIIIKTDSGEEIAEINTSSWKYLRTNDSRGDWDRREFEAALYRGIDLAGMREAEKRG